MNLFKKRRYCCAFGGFIEQEECFPKHGCHLFISTDQGARSGLVNNECPNAQMDRPIAVKYRHWRGNRELKKLFGRKKYIAALNDPKAFIAVNLGILKRSRGKKK